MVLPVLAFVLQAVGPQSGERPVRIWLDPGGTVAPGEPVHVYVRSTVGGHLFALRATTDGRIDVLFPTDPAEGTYVPAGTYEIRRPGAAASFVASEPVGSGIVLVALSPRPFRFRDSVRTVAWSSDALAGPSSDTDPEGALLAIVQRLVGDGYFNYDVAAYTVAPRPSPAPQTVADGAPGYGSCVGCSFVGVSVFVQPVPQLVICDPSLGQCVFPSPFFERKHVVGSGICQIGIDCPEGVGTSAKAATYVPRPEVSSRIARPVRPAPAAPHAVEPRRRVPGDGQAPRTAAQLQAVPLVKGIRAPAARTVVPSGRQVRLLMQRTRPSQTGAAAPPARRAPSPAAVLAAGVVAVTPQQAPSPAVSSPPPRTITSVPATVMPVRRGVAQAAARSPASGASATSAAVTAARQSRMIAAPPAARSGMRVRAGAVPVRHRQ